jgi:2-polyprenyl-3-methyl-5-hydroxy-6-metoxy-1,4-benzoquinol methylase
MQAVALGFVPRNQCPVCRSSDLVDHLVLDGIRTAICAECGFMFTRDLRTSAEIQEQYVRGYNDRRQLDGQRVNARVNLNLLRRFIGDLSDKLILDIGSGYGAFLQQAKDAGACGVVGVELSEGERAYSINKLKIRTYMNMHDIPNEEKFDIITLFEVIEHIAEPFEFLSAACERLTVGGSLIVGTDNFSSDVVKLLGDKFPKWIPHEHISLFTGETLSSVVQKIHGLKITNRRSFTSWELLLRQVMFKATAGRRGGKSFSLQAEQSAELGKPFRFFAARLALNSLWFDLMSRRNLHGEMMYIHAIKVE